MEIVAIWIIISGIIGLIGMDRNIGGHEAFLFSLAFTPVVGFILTMASGAKDGFDKEAHEILREIKLESAGNKVMLDPMQNEKGLTPEMEFRMFQEIKLLRNKSPEGLLELEKFFAEGEVKEKRNVA